MNLLDLARQFLQGHMQSQQAGPGGSTDPGMFQRMQSLQQLMPQYNSQAQMHQPVNGLDVASQAASGPMGAGAKALEELGGIGAGDLWKSLEGSSLKGLMEEFGGPASAGKVSLEEKYPLPDKYKWAVDRPAPITTKVKDKLAESSVPVPPGYQGGLDGGVSPNSDDARALIGGHYNSYGGGVDKILDVQPSSFGSGKNWLVQDLESGRTRTHATPIHPSMVVFPK